MSGNLVKKLYESEKQLSHSIARILSLDDTKPIDDNAPDEDRLDEDEPYILDEDIQDNRLDEDVSVDDPQTAIPDYVAMLSAFCNQLTAQPDTPTLQTNSRINSNQNQNQRPQKPREAYRKMESSKCHLCGMVCSSAHKYGIHMRDEHAVDRPFTCKECYFTFKLPQHLKEHNRRHDESVKPFVCEKCGKKFIHSGSIRYHKNYVCRITKT